MLPGTPAVRRATVGHVKWRRAPAVPWLATAARLVLGGVFVVAGVLKVPDPAAAVRAVRAYRLLPEPLVAPVAFGLPVVEIAVGLALLLGVSSGRRRSPPPSCSSSSSPPSARPGPAGCRSTAAASATAARWPPGRPRIPLEILRDTALLLIALALARWPGSRLALGHPVLP